MSMLSNPQGLKLTCSGKSRVKKDQRQDVDINKLVASQAARQLGVPVPVYMDLTKLPRSKGEASQILERHVEWLQAAFPNSSMQELLALSPEDLYERLKARASKRDELDNADRAGSSARGNSGGDDSEQPLEDPEDLPDEELESGSSKRASERVSKAGTRRPGQGRR